MSSSDQIKQLIGDAIETQHIIADLNGANINLVVVSKQFEGLSSVKKQQMVYACLNDLIASGDLHAVTMKLYTAAEWEKAKHLV
ncbi:MAG: BolA/IbaG family iron-sulfur metabolism protein [Gammaproteobacteria bacterium]|nr:BolA/IbaG family iron-sulfur metabolism protein [Gammaproteobacteria bacterium]